MVNSGSRIICVGTMMPARNSSRTVPRPFHTITSSAKPAATPTNSMISASEGNTTMTLLRM